MNEWTPARVLERAADGPMRIAIFLSVLDRADKETRDQVRKRIAAARGFRKIFVNRLSNAELAAHLAGLAHLDSLSDILRDALRAFHMHERAKLMHEFLDLCGIPNKDGLAEDPDISKLTPEKVVATAHKLRGPFQEQDIILYVASAAVCVDGWEELFGAAADQLLAERGKRAARE
jgi:hypothetical protein